MKLKNKLLILSGIGAAFLAGCSNNETTETKIDVDSKSEVAVATLSKQKMTDLQNLRTSLLDNVWDYNGYSHYDFENTKVVLENRKVLTEEERKNDINFVYQHLANLNLIDDSGLQNYQASLIDIAISLQEKKLELIELEPKIFKDGGYGLIYKAEYDENDLTRFKELTKDIIDTLDAEKQNILRLEIALSNDIDISEEEVTEFLAYKKLIPEDLKDKYPAIKIDDSSLWGITARPVLTAEGYAEFLSYTGEVKKLLTNHSDNKFAQKELDFIDKLKTQEEYEKILSDVKSNLNAETSQAYYETSLSIYNYLDLLNSFLLGDLEFDTAYEMDSYERYFTLEYIYYAEQK